MQGSNADIIKVAMIRIARRLREEGRGARLVLQVHDELLLEGPEADLLRIVERLCEIMVGAIEMKARLHVDLKIGPNWEDMKPLAQATLIRA
jgi:DNA polymerase I